MNNKLQNLLKINTFSTNWGKKNTWPQELPRPILSTKPLLLRSGVWIGKIGLRNPWWSNIPITSLASKCKWLLNLNLQFLSLCPALSLCLFLQPSFCSLQVILTLTGSIVSNNLNKEDGGDLIDILIQEFANLRN